MRRPYEVTCIRYYYGIFPRYKDDMFVRQKSLHMCPTSTFYVTYGNYDRTFTERSKDGRLFGGMAYYGNTWAQKSFIRRMVSETINMYDSLLLYWLFACL